MTDLIYKSVLQKAQELDAGTRITSVSRRDADDSVLVRLAPTKSDSQPLMQALRDSWPLATVSLVKNLVNGRTEAQMLLPNEDDQREIAKLLAQQSAWQKPLRLLANSLIALLALACVHQVVEISNGPNAGR